MTIEELTIMAEEYLTGNYTMADLAKKHRISKSTVVRGLGGSERVRLPEELQNRVNSMKNDIWYSSKRTLGNAGHTKHTDEEIQDKARRMVESGTTLRELGKEDNVPSLTLYTNFTKERLGEELYEQIQDRYALNKNSRGDSSSQSSSDELSQMFSESPLKSEEKSTGKSSRR